MANIEKRSNKNGKTTFRAKIRLKGHKPISSTFDSIEDAKQWVEKTESKIKKKVASKLTSSLSSEKVVLCLPSHLAIKLKEVAKRGHRSNYIISILEDHFKIENRIMPNIVDAKRLVSVKHIPKLYPAFTEGGIRHLINNEHKNNFSKCYRQIGFNKRKIVIDLDEFEMWIKNQ